MGPIERIHDSIKYFCLPNGKKRNLDMWITGIRIVMVTHISLCICVHMCICLYVHMYVNMTKGIKSVCITVSMIKSVCTYVWLHSSHMLMIE